MTIARAIARAIAPPLLHHSSTTPPPLLHHSSTTPPPLLHHSSTSPPPPPLTTPVVEVVEVVEVVDSDAKVVEVVDVAVARIRLTHPWCCCSCHRCPSPPTAFRSTRRSTPHFTPHLYPHAPPPSPLTTPEVAIPTGLPPPPHPTLAGSLPIEANARPYPHQCCNHFRWGPRRTGPYRCCNCIRSIYDSGEQGLKQKMHRPIHTSVATISVDDSGERGHIGVATVPAPMMTAANRA